MLINFNLINGRFHRKVDVLVVHFLLPHRYADNEADECKYDKYNTLYRSKERLRFEFPALQYWEKNQQCQTDCYHGVKNEIITEPYTNGFLNS